jgi:hypothetical protein
MTGMNRRIHPNQPTLGFSDPCPVCLDRHDRTNTIYCSAQCTALANTFRTTFRINFWQLTAVGFSIEFVDGVYPKIHIPSYANRFYPSRQTSFQVTCPGGININHIDYNLLRGIIYEQIGEHAATFLRRLNRNSIQNLDSVKKEFEQWLTLGLQADDTHFICYKCNNLYLKSMLTSWYEENQCEDCSFLQIPF